MKKLFLILVVSALCNTALNAQVKFDEEAIKSKIAKSDADIANPKRNAKASVWIERGKVLLDASSVALTGLYAGIEPINLKLIFGDPIATDTKVADNVQYTVNKYKYFDAYLADGKVVYWLPTVQLADNLLEDATAAFQKAYEIDGASRGVRDGYQGLVNAYKGDAYNKYADKQFANAAADYRKAFDLGASPVLNIVDTSLVYNAGLLYAMSEKPAEAIENFEIAKKYNFEEGGELYYYLFLCHFTLKNFDESKKILQEGLAKYPGNSKIVEGFSTLYSTTGEDPSQVLKMVEDMIRKEPDNAMLWSSLGVLYNKMGQVDKSIDAFKKSADLLPQDFGLRFNVGLLYVIKADKEFEAFGKKTGLSKVEYDAGLEGIYDMYQDAIEPFEQALAINPADRNCVVYLKEICFRLRDREGIMDKFTKYKEMLEAMPE